MSLTIREIHEKAIQKAPTGVIQDQLMNIDFTLEEADLLINYWYRDKPEEWFEYENCGCGKK